MGRKILKLLARMIPSELRAQIKNFKILAVDFGQWRSIKENIPIDKEGNPIPWYTYPAIEYLKRLNVSDKTIFEWGSGNSSLFWAKRAKEVVSIEHDKKWFNMVNRDKLDNQKIIFLEEKSDYVEVILSQNKRFDIIVVDGRHRYECSKNAVRCLSECGLIILDNSDWYPKTASLLRDHGLHQIDFSGFGPSGWNAWATSVFFTRGSFNSFRFTQPLQPVGGIRQHGEE